jgi:hypothetical protein
MAARRPRGRPAHADVLTPAEWRVLHAVQHGLSNGEIAARRGISRDAVMLSAQGPPAAESILYLSVGDIRAAHELLRSRGVQFGEAPHMIHRHADGTEEWLAHFNDPEGRPLGILSQVRP